MAYVQSAHSPDSNDAGATSVSTAAFASAPTAGNCIVGHVSWLGANNPATELTSITDSNGNSYTILDRVNVNTGDAVSMATFLAQNIGSGAALTVTANFSGSMQFRRIAAHEYGSVATTGQPDAHTITAENSTFTTTTDAAASPNGTTTHDGCAIWSVGYDEQNATAPAAGTANSPTSRDTETFTAGDAWRAQDFVQASAGSIAATFTNAGVSGDHIGVAMVALAPSGGGGGPTVKTLAALGVG